MPTTEQDVTDFDHALTEYKKKHGRMFPTCSEILEVAQAIGFEKMQVDEYEDDDAFDDNFEPDEEFEIELEESCSDDDTED